MPCWPRTTDDVRDAIARAEALTARAGQRDFLAISAAFKRIKNILRQAEEKGEHFSYLAEGGRLFADLVQTEEKTLINAFIEVAAKVDVSAPSEPTAKPLAAIATLRPAVDAFFDKVMVLDPDPQCAKCAAGTDPGHARRVLRHRRLQRDCDGIAGSEGLCSHRKLRRDS